MPSPPPASYPRWFALVCGLVPTVVGVVIFGWILDCSFFLDDYLHLYNAANDGYLRLVLTPHGGHTLLTTNSGYFLLYGLFGPAPRGWFLIVLLTHAVNVLLLYRALLGWTRRPGLAGSLALLWAISPVDQGVLSWIAVYGQALTATFLLWLLGDLARLDPAAGPVSWSVQLKWMLLLLGAATSFGVGTGIGLCFWIAAPVLLPAVANRRRVVAALALLPFLIGGLYAGQRWLYLQRWGSHPIPWDAAPLVMTEGGGHPLTYLLDAGVRFIGLVGYGLVSLLFGPAALSFSHGPFPLGWWENTELVWISRGMAVAALAVAIIILRAAGWRRRVAVGLGVLIAACYAPVAVVLSARILKSLHVYNVAVGDAAVLAPRYQYVGPALLALVVGIIAQTAIERWRALSTALPLLLIAWLVVAGPAYWAGRKALSPPQLGGAIVTTMQDLHASAQRYPIGSDAYVENRALRMPFMGHTLNFPGLAAFFVIFNTGDTLDGRRIRFVESDADMRRILTEERGRVAGLLVAPDDAAATPLRKPPP